MENSNECKKNFVAVYDGSSAIEDLKVIYCLTHVSPLTVPCRVIVQCSTSQYILSSGFSSPLFHYMTHV